MILKMPDPATAHRTALIAVKSRTLGISGRMRKRQGTDRVQWSEAWLGRPLLVRGVLALVLVARLVRRFSIGSHQCSLLGKCCLA